MTPGVTSFCARIYVSLKRGPGAAPGTDVRRLSKPASALCGPGAAGSSLPAGKRGREGRAPGPRSRANRVSETQGLDPSPASQQTARHAAVHPARTKPGPAQRPEASRSAFQREQLPPLSQSYQFSGNALKLSVRKLKQNS